jgi:hypothetical protein
MTTGINFHNKYGLMNKSITAETAIALKIFVCHQKCFAQDNHSKHYCRS